MLEISTESTSIFDKILFKMPTNSDVLRNFSQKSKIDFRKYPWNFLHNSENIGKMFVKVKGYIKKVHKIQECLEYGLSNPGVYLKYPKSSEVF